jgi:bacterial/archaeal transporter family protein
MQALLIIGAIILYGLWAFLDKIAVDRINSYAVQIITSIVSIVTAPILYYLIPKDNRNFDLSGSMFACGGALAAISATVLYLTAVSKGSVSVVTGLTATYPLITFFLAIFFLGEPFQISRLLGLLSIVLGAFLLSR